MVCFLTFYKRMHASDPYFLILFDIEGGANPLEVPNFNKACGNKLVFTPENILIQVYRKGGNFH